MSNSDTDFFRGGTANDNGPPTDDTIQAVTSYLDTLKTEGGTILVTGEISDQLAQTQIKAAFGRADRKQVLALTDTPDTSATAYLPDGVHPDDPGVDVITRPDFTRSAAPSTPSADSGLPELDLVNFREAILDAILDLQSTPPAPGALRVVVNSVDQLVDRCGRDATRSTFARRLATYVENARGLLYLHLRYPDNCDHVDFFTQLADARIELRYGPTADAPDLQQRWHIPAKNLTTKWFKLQT